MYKYPVVEMSARDQSRVEQVVGTKDLPWWNTNPTAPSTKYFVCVFDPEELGQPDRFGKEKKLFRFVRMDGDREVVISSGIVEQEKFCVRNQKLLRQIWVRERMIGDCFFFTLPEVEKSVPQSVVESGFKGVIDQITASRR
jgi:hypothetical protein